MAAKPTTPRMKLAVTNCCSTPRGGLMKMNPLRPQGLCLGAAAGWFRVVTIPLMVVRAGRALVMLALVPEKARVQPLRTLQLLRLLPRRAQAAVVRRCSNGWPTCHAGVASLRRTTMTMTMTDHRFRSRASLDVRTISKPAPHVLRRLRLGIASGQGAIPACVAGRKG